MATNLATNLLRGSNAPPARNSTPEMRCNKSYTAVSGVHASGTCSGFVHGAQDQLPVFLPFGKVSQLRWCHGDLRGRAQWGQFLSSLVPCVGVRFRRGAGCGFGCALAFGCGCWTCRNALISRAMAACQSGQKELAKPEAGLYGRFHRYLRRRFAASPSQPGIAVAGSSPFCMRRTASRTPERPAVCHRDTAAPTNCC